MNNLHKELDLNFFSLIKETIPLSLQFILQYISLPLALIFLHAEGTIEDQAILTLSVTFTNLLFTHLIGIGGCVLILCSKYLKSHKYQKLFNNFAALVIIDLVLYILPISGAVYCEEIIDFLGLDKFYTQNLPPLIRKLFFLKTLENFNNILVSLITLQKLFKFQNYSNMISLSVYVISAYISFVYFKMGAYGYLWAYGAKLVIETISYSLILFYKNEIRFKIPQLSCVLQEVKKKFKSQLYILFGVFGAIFTAELNTYFAAKTHSLTEIVTWQYFINIEYFMIQVQLGFISLQMTYCGYQIGCGNRKLFDIWWKKIFIVGFFVLLILNLLCVIFSYELAGIFTGDEKVRLRAAQVFKFVILTSPQDYITIYFENMLRLIKREFEQFIIATLSLPVMMIAINYYFHTYTTLGNVGLAIGYCITYLINNIVYYYIYKRDEKQFWEIEIQEMSHLQSDQMSIQEEEEKCLLLSQRKLTQLIYNGIFGDCFYEYYCILFIEKIFSEQKYDIFKAQSIIKQNIII